MQPGGGRRALRRSTFLPTRQSTIISQAAITTTQTSALTAMSTCASVSVIPTSLMVPLTDVPTMAELGLVKDAEEAAKDEVWAITASRSLQTGRKRMGSR